MFNILILQGPNLNLLGIREPNIYGNITLDELHRSLKQCSQHRLSFLQSNAEHELIDYIHNSRDKIDMIIFNPAAFTHTSIALRDALLAVSIPFALVHISSPAKREKFRQQCFFSDIAAYKIEGQGVRGYHAALARAHEILEGVPNGR